MTCCKADEYGGWCKDLPAMQSLRFAEKFCEFHNPKDKNPTSKSVEKFNKKIFEHIQEAIDSGEECNLSGTIFPGPISFGQFGEDLTFPAVDFSYATFSGEVDFKGITFCSKVSFLRCKFNDKSIFARNNFDDVTRFTRCTFSGLVNFQKNIFSGDFNIVKSTFKAGMLCSSCTFKGARTLFNES